MEIKAKFKEEMIEKCYKCKRNFLLRLTCVSFCVLLFLVYFVTPISKVENCSFKGNYYLSDDDIVEIMGVDDKTFLFNVDKDSSTEYLVNHPLIQSATLSLSFVSMSVNIEEISPAAKDDETIYLKDGSVFDFNAYENIIDEKIIDNLPYLLNDNAYYASFNNDTRYILYEMALIFISKFDVDLDFIDFHKSELGNFFCFYIKVNDNYENVFSVENGYLEFLFDASCVADYFKDDMLINLVEDFVEELNSLIVDNSLKSYDEEEMNLKDEIKNVKTFYVYPEKGNGNVSITA